MASSADTSNLSSVKHGAIVPTGEIAASSINWAPRHTAMQTVRFGDGSYGKSSVTKAVELRYHSSYQGKRKGVIAVFSPFNGLTHKGKEIVHIEIPLADIPNEIEHGDDLVKLLLGISPDQPLAVATPVSTRSMEDRYEEVPEFGLFS